MEKEKKEYSELSSFGGGSGGEAAGRPVARNSNGCVKAKVVRAAW